MFLSASSPSIIELGLQPTFDRFAHGARNDDATGRGLGFEAGRDVYAITVEVFAFHDQVAKVQADPEHDGACLQVGRGWLQSWPAGMR